jgi:hypothetical protein
MLLDSLTVETEAFEAGTGWELKEQGACRGEVCIPLGGAAGATVDVADLAPRMGLPLVQDEEHGLWALGPWSGGGRTLISAEAPELRLPDLDGNQFSLSSLRGTKVLLVAWAPY